MFQPELKSRVDEDISILVRLDNHPWNYLCDCGDASGLTVGELQNTAAVFISHTHIDHFVNFDALIRHQLGTERIVVVCGPAGIAEQVQAKLRAYTWNLVAAGAIRYEIREITRPGHIKVFELEPPSWALQERGTMAGTMAGHTIFSHADFDVSYVLLDHKTPVAAWKFKERDSVKIDIEKAGVPGGPWVGRLKSAYEDEAPETPITIAGETKTAGELFHWLVPKPGDSLGVIMDHAANEKNHTLIRAHFTGCRTVFIESFYQASDAELATANFHSYSTMSGNIMKDCAVPEAVPVHFSRRYGAEDIARLLSEFEAAYRT